MAVLRQEGFINTWSDRAIDLGDDFSQEIESNLSKSELFIAILSPDYLASEWCRKEMDTALILAGRGLKVAAIIAEPCEWKQTPLAKLLVAPQNGKALSLWDNENVAFLDVIGSIRQLLVKDKEMQPSSEPMPVRSGNKQPGGQKYRVKTDFNAIDKHRFATVSFRVISDYFSDSVRELNSIDGSFEAVFQKLDDDSFSAMILNTAKADTKGMITIRVGGMGLGLGNEITI